MEYSMQFFKKNKTTIQPSNSISRDLCEENINSNVKTYMQYSVQRDLPQQESALSSSMKTLYNQHILIPCLFLLKDLKLRCLGF